MPGPVRSDTHSRLWLPPAGLSACVRGVMIRSTLGVALDAASRFNIFPATPLCTLSWTLAGQLEVLAIDGYPTLAQPRTPVQPAVTFGGPTTGPMASWSPGPMHGLLVLLQPDAVQQLTGLDVSAWVNRWDDARAVLPPDWLAMCDAVRDAPDDEARLGLLQAFLTPRWQQVRPAQPMHVHRYRDWLQSLALRAAVSGPGKSLRQVERRIKRWAGLTMRELRGLSRAEQAFFSSMLAHQHGRPNWAQIADANGYADQSHLTRESRRVTGFPPEELYRLILQDECFWGYRLWQ